ncbi:MAG: hypothetical protein HY205_05875 [Nitrospirae bacterium]|nr:hypothetical protein [Nitrospirota bacterium]MBI3808157.1 hypothetical protein [Nitrospirota bacterium]
MLSKLSGLMMLFLMGAVLLGPLIYALATLCGMKHRRFYPLLRFKERSGCVSMPKVHIN